MPIIFIYILAVLFIVAGITHFLKPLMYQKILPRWVPMPKMVVLLSGLVEIILGVCLLVPQWMKVSAWAMIIFLILVFPANIEMAKKYYRKRHPYLWIAIIRLPLQFLLIWWACQYT